MSEGLMGRRVVAEDYSPMHVIANPDKITGKVVATFIFAGKTFCFLKSADGKLHRIPAGNIKEISDSEIGIVGRTCLFAKNFHNIIDRYEEDIVYKDGRNNTTLMRRVTMLVIIDGEDQVRKIDINNVEII